jgi:hypothetical protein
MRKVCASYLLPGVVVAFSAGVASAQTPPPCGPNHTMPAGYSSCRDERGNLWVAPPPGVRREMVPPPPGRVVPPPAGDQNPTAPHEPDGNRSSTPSKPPGGESSSWFTIAGVTAVTGFLAAIVGLIKVLKRN